MFWSISPEQSLSRTSTFVMLAILLWLVYQYADSFLRIRWIMYVFIAGIIAMMCNLYLNFFFDVGLGIGGGEYRVDVAMSNANGVANYLTVVAAFAYYFIAGRGVKVNRLLKIAGWGIIIAAVVGVFLTGSRAGVIGLALSMGVTMLTAIRSGWKPAAMFILRGDGRLFRRPVRARGNPHALSGGHGGPHLSNAFGILGHRIQRVAEDAHRRLRGGSKRQVYAFREIGHPQHLSRAFFWNLASSASACIWRCLALC